MVRVLRLCVLAIAVGLLDLAHPNALLSAEPKDEPVVKPGVALSGRSGAMKTKTLKQFGSNDESERTVARGLAWLARQQKPDGSWEFDGTSKADTVAATGLCLMAFLGAGEDHKNAKKYQKTVENGLKFLIASQKGDGSFETKGFTMYTHGIATIALCEAYAMTRDRTLLLRPAQAATNFIVAKQAEDGSWGYAPGSPGDTSILGWNSQALYAATVSKDIIVPDKTKEKVGKFLDKVASGDRKCTFGYTAPTGAPGTSLSAIGLITRHTFNRWISGHAGLAEGVEGLGKRGPQKAPAKPDMYYYYYATRAVFYAGSDEWKDWNEGKMENGKRTGGMRDWLIALQDKMDGANSGSWEADNGIMGANCGKLGTTALSVLTLEVYYRYLPIDFKEK